MKDLRNMCSTPQKQPAAKVALWQPSVTWMAPAVLDGPRDMLEERENGRISFAMKDGMVAVNMMR